MSKMAHKHVTILEINIASTTEHKVLRFVRDSLGKKKKFIIVTPNPEQVILAQKDNEFKRVLNAVDYAICDAVGLAQAAKYLSLKSPKNKYLRLPAVFLEGLIVGMSTFINRNWLESELTVIKGRDLFIKLIQLANKKRWRVFLLGGEITGTAEKTAKKLSASYKSAIFRFADGHMMDDNAKPRSSLDKKIEGKVIDKINKFKPHLLFVGFGAPKQEKWVYRWLQKLNIGGAVVVGGTFDYIAGNVKTPPKWMSTVGLEWLWRMVTQPKRIKRIITASVIFPIKIYLHKFSRG
jgi:N-acetylglucosaminyldiphosphoundecaprenol N-acetyl-beta-D-mannosaminyltransferase